MAESLAERLKRIAREKAASAAGGASGPAVVAPVETVVEEPVVEEVTQPVVEPVSIEETKVAILGMELARVDEEVKTELAATATTADSKPQSTHPLAMAFAELEAGLLARDPEFKTKLRDIHRHLGREPELVTQMTEAEIALIVTGMVVFANAEIVEPAAKKAGKAAVKAASKVVISADDL